MDAELIFRPQMAIKRWHDWDQNWDHLGPDFRLFYLSRALRPSSWEEPFVLLGCTCAPRRLNDIPMRDI